MQKSYKCGHYSLLAHRVGRPDGVCVSSNVHTLTDIFICVYMCMCTHDASSISELVS